ncbi:MAG: glycosyltransferase [Burkholderiaceae bacterium]
MLLGFESAVLRRFDRTSTISTRMLERLLSLGVARERSAIIPNWIDLKSIQPALSGADARAMFGLPADAIIVLYAGNIGEKQGLEVLVQAARSLRERTDLLFLIAGAGAALERIRALAADLEHLRWLPVQPLEHFGTLLSLADLHVLPQRAGAEDLVMPSKLTGMLASSRAVIGTASPDSELGMVLERCGCRVDPGDADALAGAIVKLAEDAKAREALGLAGRRYAETHLAIEPILLEFERQARNLVDDRVRQRNRAFGRQTRKRNP